MPYALVVERRARGGREDHGRALHQGEHALELGGVAHLLRVPVAHHRARRAALAELRRGGRARPRHGRLQRLLADSALQDSRVSGLRRSRGDLVGRVRGLSLCDHRPRVCRDPRLRGAHLRSERAALRSSLPRFSRGGELHRRAARHRPAASADGRVRALARRARHPVRARVLGGARHDARARARRALHVARHLSRDRV